jgi:hypothetical protein
LAQPHFTKLDDFVLAPPLPALLAVVMVAGLAHLGWRLARRLRGDETTATDVAAGFIVMAGVVAALVHGLALVHLGRQPLLRTMGWATAAVGAFELARFGRERYRRAADWIRSSLSQLNWVGRAGLCLAGCTSVFLFLAALGPPTDADSLDYHLGVPLAWLRRGGAYSTPDWMTSRLVGLGEALNMLGLASGTDALGAVLQLAGLMAAVVAVIGLAVDVEGAAFGTVLVLTAPLLLFLVPNQKPQMLPTASTTVALALVASRAGALDRATVALALGSVAFAVGSKYSFLLSGAVVCGTCLVFARRNGILSFALVAAAVAMLVGFVPNLVRNYAFYGDPLSPLLSRFIANADPGVAAFSRYLRETGGEPGLRRILQIPSEVLVTVSPGLASTVLGLGALAFLTLGKLGPVARWLTGTALVTALLVAAVGQWTARFLLEPSLWLAGAAASTGWNARKGVLFRLLLVQGLAVGAMALFAAFRLSPGALTPSLRDRVMTSSANQYAEAKWLDRVLAGDAVLIAPSMRSRALLPRPFAVLEVYSSDALSPALARARVCRLLETYGVNSAVAMNPAKDLVVANVEAAHAGAGPETFSGATRNPWNTGVSYSSSVFDVRRGCSAAQDELGPPPRLHR